MSTQRVSGYQVGPGLLDQASWGYLPLVEIITLMLWITQNYHCLILVMICKFLKITELINKFICQTINLQSVWGKKDYSLSVFWRKRSRFSREAWLSWITTDPTNVTWHSSTWRYQGQRSTSSCKLSYTRIVPETNNSDEIALIIVILTKHLILS